MLLVCYVVMEPFVGGIGSILAVLIYFGTSYLVVADVKVQSICGETPIWAVAAVVHVTCWILQFIGHYVFEGMYKARMLIISSSYLPFVVLFLGQVEHQPFSTAWTRPC